MDAFAGPPFPADSPAWSVRISDPGEIAAGLPQLLGFQPVESVVLVSLTGSGGGRVGLTVRADIPPPGHAAAVAAALTASLCTDGPSAALLAVVSEASDAPDPFPPVAAAVPGLPHRALVHALTVALASAGVPMRDALLVRRGRWWSYDCPHPCCAPAAGTPLPGGVSELEVAAVASGMVVEPTREGLAARIAPATGAARNAMAAACARAAIECSAAVLDTGFDAVAEESWAAVAEAVSRCRPGGPTGTRLTDDEVARVVWGLRDRGVRDRALALALGDAPAAAEALWTECARRAPAPLDATPATLLAVSAWLRGDGAMANVALERALDSEPGYGLARLLAQALAGCLPPAELRAMLVETADLRRDTSSGS